MNIDFEIVICFYFRDLNVAVGPLRWIFVAIEYCIVAVFII